MNLPKKQTCKEHICKIDNKNIKIIYNPEITSQKKMCDCIIICNNEKIFLVEILCGKLTSKELKDKLQQLKNCSLLKNGIKVLLYKKLESPKKDPMLKKQITNSKISLKQYTNQPIKLCN